MTVFSAFFLAKLLIGLQLNILWWFLYRYQDYQAEDIPVVEKNGIMLRVMAGESHGATGPINMRNPGMLLDVQLEKGADFQQQVTMCNIALNLHTSHWLM